MPPFASLENIRELLPVSDDRLLILADRAMRKADLLVRGLDAQDLEIHLLTDLRDVLGLLDTLVGELRDMAESLEPLAEFDKDAEVREPRYLAANDIARPCASRRRSPMPTA